MNEPQQRDWLDDALRQASRPIDDAGFTAQVIAALPPLRKQRLWLRPVILGGASLAAGIVGLLVLPGGKFVSDCVLQLVWARALSPSLVIPALVVTGLFAASFAPLAAERH
jgi:anti-sigma factor RsiW